jgi:ribonuclease D
VDLIKQAIHWIDSNDKLEAICEQWMDLELLALDTEFIRSSTYYPIAGLIQINAGDGNYLIDPQAIDDWYPLIEVIDSDQRIVAMHACSEDLEVLQLELGSLPKNIFDTQIAAGFLAMEANQGYGKLVNSVLNVELPKSETRSDWLQRPLSQSQVNYAALDVEYLYQLAEKLATELKSKERFDWVLEEGRKAFKQFKKLQDANLSYLRVKSAWKLSPRRLAVLQSLCQWRENYAQKKNVPRNRVIKDSGLLQLALSTPKHISKLVDIDGLSERTVRKQGRTLIELIRENLETSEDKLPSALPSPLAKEDKETFHKLKTQVQDLAVDHGLAPEIAFKKKEIEQLFRLQKAALWSDVDDCFYGWRRDVFAAPITKVLKEL